MDSSFSCQKDDSVSYPCDDLPSTFKALCEFSPAAVKNFPALTDTAGSALVAVSRGTHIDGLALERPTGSRSEAPVDLSSRSDSRSEAPVEELRKMPSGSPEYLTLG